MVTTAEATSTRGRHRETAPRLPVPPSDAEKGSYADRGVLLIICSSMMSFGALLISQAKFVFLRPAITWFFSFRGFHYYLLCTIFVCQYWHAQL